MRIRSINIEFWRHFKNLKLTLEPDAALVCIVGANGTGKSHLLELIAACAERLGLTQGSEIPRGNPLSDPHAFDLTFYLAPGISDTIDKGLQSDPFFAQWDRTITLKSSNVSGVLLSAGGVSEKDKTREVAESIVQILQTSEEVHFLSLDADRAYPKKNIALNEVAQAYEIDWEGKEYTRGRSFRPSSTLYDEWMKYFLAQENQSGTRLITGIRRAKKAGKPQPEFDDPFEEYATSLQKVLPHLLFTGVDLKRRTLLFDTTGLELTFNQLSGGEREIAFLIGQMDRFGLRQGLFLIDEPELHLNADLIRSWVAYLSSTVLEGQIWLATHSLEAVEAAGQRATFILERNDETRKVEKLARLDSRPVLSALSRAVGSPAFSLSKLRFVFIEGEEALGERERYRRLAGVGQDFRFLECGSCNEVTRRVSSIRALAKEGGTEIRVGGIIDRDYRSPTQLKEVSDQGVLVLPVHEVENLFLDSHTISSLVKQNGLSFAWNELIQAAADSRAGSWIFQYAMATPNAKSFPEVSSLAKDRAKTLIWEKIRSDAEKIFDPVVSASGFGDEDKVKFKEILNLGATAYGKKRETPDLWKVCEGKQVLSEVAKKCGFSGSEALTLAAFTIWEKDPSSVSKELLELRSYVGNLAV